MTTSSVRRILVALFLVFLAVGCSRLSDLLVTKGSGGGGSDPTLTWNRGEAVSQKKGTGVLTPANTLATNSGGTITYSISDGGTGSTINSRGVVTVGSVAGVARITGTVTPTTTHKAGSATYTLTVTELNPNTVTMNNSTVSKTYGDATFAVTTASCVSGTPSYSISESDGGLTLSGSGTASTLTITAANPTGVTVTATCQAVEGVYDEDRATYKVTIAKARSGSADQTVISNLGLGKSITRPLTLGTVSNGVAPTGTPTCSSNNPEIATCSGNGVITGVSPGTATISLSYAGDSNYSEVSRTISVTVIDSGANPAKPLITVSNANQWMISSGGMYSGSIALWLPNQSSSGWTLRFTSSNLGQVTSQLKFFNATANYEASTHTFTLSSKTKGNVDAQSTVPIGFQLASATSFTNTLDIDNCTVNGVACQVVALSNMASVLATFTGIPDPATAVRNAELALQLAAATAKMTAMVGSLNDSTTPNPVGSGSSSGGGGSGSGGSSDTDITGKSLSITFSLGSLAWATGYDAGIVVRNISSQTVGTSQTPWQLRLKFPSLDVFNRNFERGPYGLQKSVATQTDGTVVMTLSSSSTPVLAAGASITDSFGNSKSGKPSELKTITFTPEQSTIGGGTMKAALVFDSTVVDFVSSSSGGGGSVETKIPGIVWAGTQNPVEVQSKVIPAFPTTGPSTLKVYGFGDQLEMGTVMTPVFADCFATTEANIKASNCAMVAASGLQNIFKYAGEGGNGDPGISYYEQRYSTTFVPRATQNTIKAANAATAARKVSRAQPNSVPEAYRVPSGAANQVVPVMVVYSAQLSGGGGGAEEFDLPVRGKIVEYRLKKHFINTIIDTVLLGGNADKVPTVAGASNLDKNTIGGAIVLNPDMLGDLQQNNHLALGYAIDGQWEEIAVKERLQEAIDQIYDMCAYNPTTGKPEPSASELSDSAVTPCSADVRAALPGNGLKPGVSWSGTGTAPPTQSRPQAPNFEANLRGWIHSQNWLIEKFGGTFPLDDPIVARRGKHKVPFGWQINLWAPGTSNWIHGPGLDRKQAWTEKKMWDNGGTCVVGNECPAGSVAAFIDALEVFQSKTVDGVSFSGPDFIVFDRYEVDDFRDDVRNGGYTYDSNDWKNYLMFAKLVSNHVKLPTMLWQIPASHLPATGKTCNSDYLAKHSGTGGTFFMGDPDLGIGTTNVDPSVLAMTLSGGDKYGNAKTVGEYLTQSYHSVASYNWSKNNLQAMIDSNAFSVLWGGGNTTGVLKIEVVDSGYPSNGDDCGWMLDRTRRYYLDNLKNPAGGGSQTTPIQLPR